MPQNNTCSLCILPSILHLCEEIIHLYCKCNDPKNSYFTGIPTNPIRFRSHGLLNDQNLVDNRTRTFFQSSLTRIPQWCDASRTPKALRIRLRKHRPHRISTTNRAKIRPMLLEKKIKSTYFLPSRVNSNQYVWHLPPDQNTVSPTR